MVCHGNSDLYPSCSEQFRLIYEAWVTLVKSAEIMVDSSAISPYYQDCIFDLSGNKIVHYIPEILTKCLEVADFLEANRAAICEEAEQYLSCNRSRLWFFEAMDCLYHPTKEEELRFVFFREGTWRTYDLSYATYKADEERKEARGKTKNPNYVSDHKCCTNCICFYIDEPDYEWAKEDEEETKASNNIRINWHMKKTFEREFLESDMLETLKPLWKTWRPKPIRRQPFTEMLCRPDIKEYSFLAKPVIKYLAKLRHELCPHNPYRAIWHLYENSQILALCIRDDVAFFQDLYKSRKEEEDEYVLACRQNIKTCPVKDCYVEVLIRTQWDS